MTQPKNAAKCGTYSGYQKHRRNGNAACESCKKAYADYQFKYRMEHPADAEVHRRRVNARQRAALRVAKEYPELFDTYLAEELSA